ncbi:hypothetical protein glysoja_033878 [Glycine soja]|uniref:Uncharacterized protein n=1 Tax=Glycine soja TaxID=3848 RepID=A0A0B2RA60_GLYSO|nr:hypothetical protein glysoja_033878 [Glycine soja]
MLNFNPTLQVLASSCPYQIPKAHSSYPYGDPILAYGPQAI